MPEYLERAARALPYHRRVFIAPPWAEIFVPDAKRKQSFEDATTTFQTLHEVYTHYGYELVPLPLVSVEARAQFVRGAISRCT